MIDFAVPRDDAARPYAETMYAAAADVYIGGVHTHMANDSQAPEQKWKPRLTGFSRFAIESAERISNIEHIVQETPVTRRVQRGGAIAAPLR